MPALSSEITWKLFHELKDQFPGDHRISYSGAAFYFKTEEERATFKGLTFLLGLEPSNEGDAGPWMTDRYYITFKRNRYDNSF